MFTDLDLDYSALSLPNALYSPKVPIDAIPPNNFPPKLSLYKESLSFLLIISPYVLQNYVSPEQQTKTLFIFLMASSIATYIAVSHIYLERMNPFSSRYGTSTDFFKMLLLFIPIYYITLPSHSIETSLQYSIGLWIGAHFGCLDSIPIIQSFGMKFVRFPNGWYDFRSNDIFLLLLLVLLFIQIVLNININILFQYNRVFIVLYGSVSISIVFIKLYTKTAYIFHAHHWFNSLIVLPFVLCIENDHTTWYGCTGAYMVGILFGSCIEGIACWGLDPLFFNPYNKNIDYGKLKDFL
jgi:hypothetical protein